MTFKATEFEELARNSHYIDAAESVAGILNGTIKPEQVRETQDWIRQCFHRPAERELQMHAVNALLDLHGVEAITVEGEWLDNYHGDIVATYCNTGDTYCLTVVLDHEKDKFVLASWGDFLESWEATHEREASCE